MHGAPGMPGAPCSGELGRGPIRERAVRSTLVVISAPGGDRGARFGKRPEPVFVQALVSELPVERLNVSVLGGLSRFNQPQLDPSGVCPGVHGVARELRTLVGPNGL